MQLRNGMGFKNSSIPSGATTVRPSGLFMVEAIFEEQGKANCSRSPLNASRQRCAAASTVASAIRVQQILLYVQVRLVKGLEVCRCGMNRHKGTGGRGIFENGAERILSEQRRLATTSVWRNGHRRPVPRSGNRCSRHCGFGSHGFWSSL